MMMTVFVEIYVLQVRRSACTIRAQSAAQVDLRGTGAVRTKYGSGSVHEWHSKDHEDIDHENRHHHLFGLDMQSMYRHRW